MNNLINNEIKAATLFSSFFLLLFFIVEMVYVTVDNQFTLLHWGVLFYSYCLTYVIFFPIFLVQFVIILSIIKIYFINGNNKILTSILLLIIENILFFIILYFTKSPIKLTNFTIHVLLNISIINALSYYFNLIGNHNNKISKMEQFLKDYKN